MDWQPIETAPKDEVVLVLDTFYYRTDPKRIPHHVLRAAFLNDEDEWEEIESGEMLDGVTYWMPKNALPEFPSAPSGEEGAR